MRRIVGVAALLVVFVACGSGEQTPIAASPTEAPAAATTPQPCTDRTPPAPSADPKAGSSKPEVTVPDGSPPCKLVIQDIKAGTGAEAKEGDTVTVQYVGVSWSTKQQFDSSWDRGEPATFSLLEVIPGWTSGIPGMKVGGRRRLIVPPDLGYGATPPQGSPIAPNETLVFVVDLVDIGS